MNGHTSLTDQFLIAMPALADPNFSRTVTFLCEHSEEGALGIIINRPLEITMTEIFNQIGIDPEQAQNKNKPVFLGGPVQGDRGFVLHEPMGNWESTLTVTETVGVTTSQDVLIALAEDRGPDNWLMALGYAGWGPGQLEQEITDNAWLNGPADTGIVFRTPVEQRWRAAAMKLGVDVATLSGDAGHA